jgi:hypothetical protein
MVFMSEKKILFVILYLFEQLILLHSVGGVTCGDIWEPEVLEVIHCTCDLFECWYNTLAPHAYQLSISKCLKHWPSMETKREVTSTLHNINQWSQLRVWRTQIQSFTCISVDSVSAATVIRGSPLLGKKKEN